jgi:hypothetical protein
MGRNDTLIPGMSGRLLSAADLRTDAICPAVSASGSPHKA